MKKKYSIPICWEEADTYEVYADNLEQAIHTVREMIRMGYLIIASENALPETVAIDCGYYDKNTSDEEIAKKLLQLDNPKEIEYYYDNTKNNKSERKYIGIPTQNEITKQYFDLKGMIMYEIPYISYDKILKFANNHKNITVEINSQDIFDCDSNEEIDMIRFEYQNILVYIYVTQNGDWIISDVITVYGDNDFQFPDERFYNYHNLVDEYAREGYFELIKKSVDR